jgi:hypothetical protein
MRVAAISSVLAVVFRLSAQAGIYTYPYSDSGPIPQGGTTLSFEHSINPPLIPDSISSVELVLTFNNGYDLGGNINGALILDPSGSDINESLTPSESRAGTGSQEIYDVTFTTPFAGSNPNNIWALNLWDNNNSGIENGLVSWSLNITAVPEPVSTALGIFGGVAVCVVVARSRPVRERAKRWRVAANAWIDAV